MILAVAAEDAQSSIDLLTSAGETAFVIGEIKAGERDPLVSIV